MRTAQEQTGRDNLESLWLIPSSNEKGPSQLESALRERIRQKLNIANDTVNLTTFLQSNG